QDGSPPIPPSRSPAARRTHRADTPRSRRSRPRRRDHPASAPPPRRGSPSTARTHGRPPPPRARTAPDQSREYLKKRERDERAEQAAVRDLERGMNARLDARLRDEERHDERERRDQKPVLVVGQDVRRR